MNAAPNPLRVGLTGRPARFIDIFVSYKRNQGIGEQNGDVSPIVMTLSWVSDTDGIDSCSVKNSIV